MAKAKKVEVVIQEPVNYGGVFYSDGGARPNKGYAGFGIHAYIYDQVPPKKGSGNSHNVLTDAGYVDKAKQDAALPAVKPNYYIDAYGYFNKLASNNEAELEGAVRCVEIINEAGLKKAKVITDSQYVVVGATARLDEWKANGWKRKDGVEIKNVSQWAALYDGIQKLRTGGVDIEFKWTEGHQEGHGDSLGNRMADELATLGVLTATRSIKTLPDTAHPNTTFNCYIKTPADGYWKNNADKPDFFTLKNLYFNTGITVKNGEYALACNFKDAGTEGKSRTENSYAYIRMNKPVELIEDIKDAQRKIMDDYDGLVIINLATVYSQAGSKYFEQHGVNCLYKMLTYRKDLYLLNNEPVTRDLDPPIIAHRVSEEIEKLRDVVISWESNSQRLIETDLTNIIYTKDAKGKLKLSSNLVVGIASISVPVRYASNENGFLEKKLELFFEVDLPGRNALKKLEDQNPKVVVVSWMVSDRVFRYACIVKADTGIGGWISSDSNNVLV